MIIGPYYTKPDRCIFTVWAPFSEKVELLLTKDGNRKIAMEKDELGYWRLEISNPPEELRYLFRIDQKVERPDPASHFQPDGVHKPSQVINHRLFPWTDGGWRGIPLRDYIIYELHVGTFTSSGTFEAAIDRLGHLKELGVNVIELMPVAQFPGRRNWGYDGVYPFAVQHSYGGPPGLKHFVNTCHEQGFAVILDVVYNHLGPEGNYLRDFGPYFTDRYKTPWGEAVNFDDAWSDDVRNYFIENALHWFKNYHIDALRLDAIHAITDMSAHPFLQELAEKTEDFSRHQNREYILIAESSLNDARIVKAGSQGGFGIQAQWLDDFHHSLRTILTGEKTGYYMDFGKKEQFEKSLNDGFVYDGDYSAFRRRRHGNSSSEISAGQFVVFIQNHDQVGNRMLGERLTELTSFEAHKLAAAACLLSPYLPMIFMGEEYGEKAPFLYFVDHGDPNLVDAVRNGRKKEFSQFQWRGEPPDPQDEDTFSRSKIDISLKSRDHHRYLFKFYKELIRLRQNYPALKNLSNKKLKTGWDNTHNILVIHRWEGSDEMLILMNLNKEETKLSLEIPEGYWMKILDSNDSDWGGNGSVLPHELETGAGLTLTPREFILYHKENSK